MSRRYIQWILLAIVFVHISLVLFTHRAIFLSRYDTNYWKDRFEHSQWKLPISQRTIGDDGLYAYEGYRLMQGDNPTLLNAEVPPLGKYLIGISTSLFGNGYFYGLITTIGMVLMVFLLGKKLFQSSLLALAGAVIFATDPLVTQQYTLTMLDSLYVFLILSSLLFLLAANKSKKASLLFAVSGLFTGFAAETKFPLLLIFILFIVLYAVKKSQKPVAVGTLWIVGAALGYLIPYVPYFLSGHSFSEWFTAQKWAIHFYASSKFTFWSRYLLLLLPFLVLIGIKILSNFSKRTQVCIIGLLILLNGIRSAELLFPTPQAVLADFTYSWKHGFFQDMYEHLTNNEKLSISRTDFHRIGARMYYDGEIEAATVQFSSTALSRTKPSQQIPVTITYLTRHLGKLTETTTVHVVREQGLWKIVWDWDNLLPDLTQKDHLETMIDEARRGSIIKTGKVVASDIQSSMIWVTPDKLNSENQNLLFGLLEQLFHKTLIAVSIHHRLFGNSEPDWPVPVGVLQNLLSSADRQKLLSFPGVELSPHLGRNDVKIPVPGVGNLMNSVYEECCSVLYTTTTYDGREGLEKDYNETLKGINGGMLVLKDALGTIKKILLEVIKRDGNDVFLP